MAMPIIDIMDAKNMMFIMPENSISGIHILLLSM